MTLPRRRRRKAYGYVVRDRHLLVFREPDFPEAGVQVPGGTIERGESTEEGLVRELGEELGRTDFRVGPLLLRATYSYDAADFRHVHDRHFFLVEPGPEWPDAWEHGEPDPDHGGGPIRFAFTWTALTDPGLRLAAELDAALGALRQSVGISP